LSSRPGSPTAEKRSKMLPTAMSEKKKENISTKRGGRKLSRDTGLLPSRTLRLNKGERPRPDSNASRRELFLWKDLANTLEAAREKGGSGGLKIRREALAKGRGSILRSYVAQQKYAPVPTQNPTRGRKKKEKGTRSASLPLPEIEG